MKSLCLALGKKKALSERRKGICSTIQNSKFFFYLEPKIFLTLVLIFSLPSNKMNLDSLYITDMEIEMMLFKEH